ncbi:zinc finger protein 26 isoform X1 [Aedes aegypti]|uniref:Uncharacterized protein n=1 Tax=Aedes aegypti TaxID=7159 RepID=A0A6I8TXC3_AEDAE|nr:zinc finger protein 26 isoform X1 [Aedes aegypti]
MTAAVRLLQGQSVASICRLCFMERDQLELIFDADRGYCSQWIEKLTSLKIDNVPNAPSSLCAECKSTLESFDAFREMCITNDLVFKETFCSEDLSVGDIKVESIEDQHENIVILQTDSESNSCDIPAGQDSIDAATSTKLVIDDFEIKVHDMDTSVEANIPIMTMIPVMNGDEIGNFSHENHDSAMTDADHKFNIIGPTIDISSSVESDSSMDAESNDNPTQNLTDENNHMSLTVDDILSDCFKYPCKICNIHVSKLHIMTHQDVHLFQCHICFKAFERFNYASRHISKWHREKNDTNDKDAHNDESTSALPSSSSTADTHDNELHSEQEKSTHMCGICNKNSTKLHAMVHKAEKVFECYICLKTFHELRYCSKHIRGHIIKQQKASEEECNNVDLVHSCKICVKPVSKLHVMTHKARGLYVCYICRRRCKKMAEMIEHVKKHMKIRRTHKRPVESIDSIVENVDNSQTTVNAQEIDNIQAMLEETNKPSTYVLTCDVCMRFSSKLHVTTHKDAGIFECHICSKRFDKFMNCTRHIKLHVKRSLTGNISPIEEKEQADEHTASGSSSSTNYKKSSETHLELDVSSFTQDGTDLKREAPGLHIDSSVEDDDEDEEEDKPQDDEALSANELGPTKYVCTICNQNVSKLHVITHKADGLFQCPICPRVSNTFYNVSRHIKNFSNHTEEVRNMLASALPKSQLF